MNEKKAVAALIYDFDKTLSPKDMQEYAFIPDLGMEPQDFWALCKEMELKHSMDSILAYMLVMLKESEGKKLLNRDVFRSLGGTVELFEGVSDWFDRINAYGETLGLEVQHYIISSGLKEIIEGTAIADKFKEIYAGYFCYNERNVPIWPAMAINYTSKTQFIFRINKGVFDVNHHNELNEYMPEADRPIPFRNMIYFGDGMTDVPSMKMVKINGGHSIAVHQGDSTSANKMLKNGRVDFVCPADYTEGSKMDVTVKAILDRIKAQDTLYRYHERDKAQI